MSDMKKINLRLTKKDRIIRAENDTYNYITNSHWLIKYSKDIQASGLFTAGTNNKLNEYQDKIEMMEPDKLQGFIDNVMSSDSSHPLRDTGFYKDYGTNNFLRILATESGYMYVNNNYVKMLGHIYDYTRHHMNNTLRPIVFKHKKNDVTFLITPVRYDGEQRSERLGFALKDSNVW